MINKGTIYKYYGISGKISHKKGKEEAARLMTDEQIDEIIQSASNIYAKIFYSKLKRKNHATDTERV